MEFPLYLLAKHTISAYHKEVHAKSDCFASTPCEIQIERGHHERQPTEIPGLPEDGGVRQLHPCGGGAELLPIGHQPDDTRPGTGVEPDPAHPQPLRCPPDSGRDPAAALYQDPVRSVHPAARQGGRAERPAIWSHPHRHLLQRRHPLAAQYHPGLSEGLPQYRLRAAVGRLYRD